jgi:citrate synthase
VWYLYSPNVRDTLRRKGWDGNGARPEHSELIYIDGDELLSIYRARRPEDLVEAAYHSLERSWRGLTRESPVNPADDQLRASVQARHS